MGEVRRKDISENKEQIIGKQSTQQLRALPHTQSELSPSLSSLYLTLPLHIHNTRTHGKEYRLCLQYVPQVRSAAPGWQGGDREQVDLPHLPSKTLSVPVR